MLDWLGSICLLYICIVLDLVVDLVVCKASVLNWLLGVYLSSIYMHCTITSSGWSSIKCIYAQLTGGSICLLYIHCTRSSSWCSGMQGICAQLSGGSRSRSQCRGMQGISARLTGGSICLLYICLLLDLAVGVMVCNANMLNWWGSICLLYICIVLDLAVGVAVCKASVLNGLRGLDLALDVVVWKASVVRWQGV